MKFERLRILSVTLMFICIICFPFFNDRLHFIKDIQNSENRKLAPDPAFDVEHLDLFPAAYEKFYNDTFSLRSRMISLFSLYNLFVFKKSPCPDLVVVGNDGWLFLVGDELDTYTGRNPLTDKELADFKKELEYRKDYLAKRNCKFYFLIAPTKANIYPEKVPIELLRKRKLCDGEELIQYLRKNSTVDPIDLYGVLKENKDLYNNYYKLDNHWSPIGAFYGTNAFLSRLHKDYPDIDTLSLNDYNIAESDLTTGNTAKILLHDVVLYHETKYVLTSKKKTNAVDGKRSNYTPPEKFPYTDEYEFVKETKDTTKPKLLIISDSFGEHPFSYLAGSFKKTVKIWDNWEYKLNEPIVENEKPDIILLIVHEKNLRLLLKNASGLAK